MPAQHLPQTHCSGSAALLKDLATAPAHESSAHEYKEIRKSAKLSFGFVQKNIYIEFT